MFFPSGSPPDLRGRRSGRKGAQGVLPFLLFAALAGLVPVADAGASRVDEAGSEAGSFNFTLFHTNDSHSNFLAAPAVWRDDGKPVGGAVALAWHLAEQRKDAAPDLLVDAGDFMTGNPLCTLEVDGVVGGAIPALMNALGYDVGVVGNHEFDLGRAGLQRLVTRFDFPLLAADIVDADGKPVLRAEPAVFARGGLQVGVIGVSCTGMHGMVTTGRLDGARMADQERVVCDQAAALDPGTDLLIVITHSGVEGDRELARRLAAAGAGVDVIVGGHSHTRLTAPEVVDGILIVQAGSKWTHLGRLDLRVENDRVVRHRGRLIELWAEGTAAGEELAGLVERFGERVDREFSREIGTLAVDWRTGRGETNIGNWLADQVRLRAEADVAFVNSGTIRKAMRAGPITLLDIHEMLPFSNTLVTLELSGEQLRAVLLHNARAQAGGRHGILQVSGAEYEFRVGPDGETVELTQAAIGGRPLAPQALYVVAMPDYVAMMGETYLAIDLPPMHDLGVTMTRAIVEAVEMSGPITSRIEGRIRRLD